MRAIGMLTLLVGIALLLWTFVVWRWNDPFTGAYTRWEQHKLVKVHDRLVADFRTRHAHATPASPAVAAREISRDARLLRREAAAGSPIGHIVVPRLGLDMLMMNGTNTAALKRGPGIDRRTYLPGQGELVYIAGHRTTYLAPFGAIDRMRRGDRVTLTMPYGRFDYVVTRHQIVESDDLSVLESHGNEIVALQACHPRFFATHRYIVWAKPVEVTPIGGSSYRPRAA